MFDYTLIHWTAFVSAAALLCLSPGPDNAFILGNTLRWGRRSGFAALLGAYSGTLVHIVMAAAGLSAILASSALAFTVVKWLGAGYLIWLGIQALRSRSSGSYLGGGSPEPDNRRIFRQGCLICALNPKVAIFFLAFLPQFVVEGAGPVWAQLLFHGLLFLAVAAIVEPPLILAIAWMGRRLRANHTIGLWLDKVLGTVLVALGIRLALLER